MIVRSEPSRNTGTDGDGVAQSEADQKYARVRGRRAKARCIRVKSKAHQQTIRQPIDAITSRISAHDFRWRMLRNGSYSAWFRTRHQEGTGVMQGEGTGVIELNDGKVTGGDSGIAYTGSYVVDGDKFTAFIATERHTPGQPSVFGIGIDDVNLTLTGKSTPTTASCTGTAKQAPGLAFEATLIRIADQPRALPRAPTRPRSPASVILNPSQIARDARSKK